MEWIHKSSAERSYQCKQYNFNDSLSDAHSKLFTYSKRESHMLPLWVSSRQMTLRPRGHPYDVPRVGYDPTKRSLYPPSERSETGVYTVLLAFLSVHPSVRPSVCAHSYLDANISKMV